jgi:hypothetical protein
MTATPGMGRTATRQRRLRVQVAITVSQQICHSGIPQTRVGHTVYSKLLSAKHLVQAGGIVVFCLAPEMSHEFYDDACGVRGVMHLTWRQRRYNFPCVQHRQNLFDRWGQEKRHNRDPQQLTMHEDRRLMFPVVGVCSHFLGCLINLFH